MILDEYLATKSEKAAYHYRCAWKAMANAAGKTPETLDADLIAKPQETINQLRVALYETDMAVSTRDKLWRMLATYLKWLFYNAHIPKLPQLPKERMPKKWVDEYDVATPEDVAAIESAILRMPQHDRAIQMAMLYLLYYRAFRKEEMLSITLGDIDFQNKTISAIEKHGEDKNPIPVSDGVLEGIQECFDLAKSLAVRAGLAWKRFPLIFSMYPGYTGEALCGHCITELVSVWGGWVDKKLTPHSMRRSAISNAVSMGAHVIEAAAFARHSTAYMIERYYQRREEGARRVENLIRGGGGWNG